MLAIISDLHLTDGTTGTKAAASAFHGFANRLSDLAMQASWRADGYYRPIKQLDLLLLGDVFDVIDSNKWLASDVRPWHDNALKSSCYRPIPTIKYLKCRLGEYYPSLKQNDLHRKPLPHYQFLEMEYKAGTS